MERTHTLDLSRLIHLEAQAKAAAAASRAAHDHLMELNRKHMQVKGHLNNAKKIARGESSYYPDESVSWQDTNAIRETWSEKAMEFQKELDELDAKIGRAQAEYSKTGEQHNATLGLLDRCKKFIADRRRDEVEANFSAIEEAAAARSHQRLADG